MLKELRNKDPMLAAFQSALSNPQIVGRKYSKQTIRSYAWHCRAFLQYCRALHTSPRQISQKRIELYLQKIWDEVQEERLSRPFFLQACTTLETLYRTSVDIPFKADSIPTIRERLTEKIAS